MKAKKEARKCTICGITVENVFNDNAHTFMGIGAMHWLKVHEDDVLNYVYAKVGKDAGNAEDNERQLFTMLYPDGDILTVELGVYDEVYDFIEANSEVE